MTANFVASAAQQLNAKQVAGNETIPDSAYVSHTCDHRNCSLCCTARKLLTVLLSRTTVGQRLHHRLPDHLHHHRARMMVRNVDTVLAALEPAAADPIHTGASLQAARLIYTVNACRKERTAGGIPALLAHAAAAVRATHLAIIAPECIHPA